MPIAFVRQRLQGEDFTANELANVIFNREYQLELTNAIISTFDRDNIATLPVSTNRDNTVVFVVGMPRSGTTLVEQIIASHSEAFGAGELTWMHDIATALPAELGSSRPFPADFEKVTSNLLNKLSCAHTQKLQTLSKGAKVIVDKMPSNFVYLGLTAQLLPNARIIHCMRNPMDTCLSCYCQNFSRGQFFSYIQSDLAFYYNLYQRLMQHWKTVLKLPILEVQYEDLVKTQKTVTKEIVKFTGLD